MMNMNCEVPHYKMGFILLHSSSTTVLQRRYAHAPLLNVELICSIYLTVLPADIIAPHIALSYII